MSKNMKGAIVVAILLIGGYFVYTRTIVSKSKQIDFLIANNYTGGSPASLSAFEDGFVEAWYKAAKAKKTIFAFNNKSYNTNGATAVK